MENNDGTLKELAKPWCIQYLQLKPTQSYKLKSELIHLLPKFHGLAEEDPHKHLKEFHVVCSTMRPHWIPEDYIKMKAFFLASRTTTIWKEICGIRKHSRETLHEYWERFNKLCATCSYHQINEQLLIQYFYEGLMMMDRNMIDAASGGALMDKTPTAARHLILNMASNMTQGVVTSRVANKVGTIDNLRLENQLIELASLRVEINIPLLDAIKQISKYAKFLKELCMHKSKKMKGGVEMGGVVSALIKSEEVATLTQQAMPKKCRDPEIFSIPCTIGDCTFANAMLDLVDFYVLDMEDETSRKGSTLILG
ncbi:hypothetical protein CR513_01174, partial [Mucuna pruriens]